MDRQLVMEFASSVRSWDAAVHAPHEPRTLNSEQPPSTNHQPPSSALACRLREPASCSPRASTCSRRRRPAGRRRCHPDAAPRCRTRSRSGNVGSGSSSSPELADLRPRADGSQLRARHDVRPRGSRPAQGDSRTRSAPAGHRHDRLGQHRHGRRSHAAGRPHVRAQTVGQPLAHRDGVPGDRRGARAAPIGQARRQRTGRRPGYSTGAAACGSCRRCQAWALPRAGSRRRPSEAIATTRFD